MVGHYKVVGDEDTYTIEVNTSKCVCDGTPSIKGCIRCQFFLKYTRIRDKKTGRFIPINPRR